MRQRPLPKTVSPVPDELLSGWLTRLAATNHCDLEDLLAHIGIPRRYAFKLDFGLEADTAERIATVARADPNRVLAMAFPKMTPLQASLTGMIAFQTCPDCRRDGLELRHWRKAWVLDCGACGTGLTAIVERPGAPAPHLKHLRRAKIGANLLEAAVQDHCRRRVRRALRSVGFAQALLNVSGSDFWALKSFDPEVRRACLAAIACAQRRPLLKAAWIYQHAGDLPKLYLLKHHLKTPHLLAALDRIRLPARRTVKSPDREPELDILNPEPAPTPRQPAQALSRKAVDLAFASRAPSETIRSVYRRADRIFQELEAEMRIRTNAMGS